MKYVPDQILTEIGLLNNFGPFIEDDEYVQCENCLAKGINNFIFPVENARFIYRKYCSTLRANTIIGFEVFAYCEDCFNEDPETIIHIDDYTLMFSCEDDCNFINEWKKLYEIDIEERVMDKQGTLYIVRAARNNILDLLKFCEDNKIYITVL